MVSRSKEKGGIDIPYLFLLLPPIIILRSKLQSSYYAYGTTEESSREGHLLALPDAWLPHWF
jgi:hypothetical protein